MNDFVFGNLSDVIAKGSSVSKTGKHSKNKKPRQKANAKLNHSLGDKKVVEEHTSLSMKKQKKSSKIGSAENTSKSQEKSSVQSAKNLEERHPSCKRKPSSVDPVKVKKKKKRNKAQESLTLVDSAVKSALIDSSQEKNIFSQREKKKRKRSADPASEEIVTKRFKSSKKKEKGTKKDKTNNSAEESSRPSNSETFEIDKSALERTFSMPTDKRHLGKTAEDARKSFSIRKKRKKESIENRLKNSLPAHHPDAEKRTIFVGNVDCKLKRKAIERFFKKYGKVESVRIRGVAVSEVGISKKEAITTGKIHPKRETVIAYVRFEDESSVEKALKANGSILNDKHIRVDRSLNDCSKEDSNSIFVGNLAYEAENEMVHKFFRSCGEINNVRVVRSNETGASKGVCFVSFKTRDAVELALQMNGQSLYNKALRIKRAFQNKVNKYERKVGGKGIVYKHERQQRKKGRNISFMKLDKPNHIKEREYKERMENMGFAGHQVSTKGKGEKKSKFNKTEKINRLNAKLLASAGGLPGKHTIFKD